MEHTEETPADGLIDLGQASTETRGGPGQFAEILGMQPLAGHLED